MNAPAIRLSISDVVAEYDAKVLSAPEVESALKAASDHAMAQACVGSTYGEMSRPKYPSATEIRRSLLKSAWRHVYDGLNIGVIVGATEKKRIDFALQSPPPFTIENIRDTFGDYVIRPRYHILKGLAEIFCALDPAFKSHSKVRIGVKGLPKRVIMSGFNNYSGFGRDRVRDMLRAIAACNGEQPPTHTEMADLVPHGVEATSGHGISIKRFNNGNAHIYFDKETLKTVNLALSEFYGDVLPDEAGEKPTAKQASTAVSKDLQYYPTPKAVVDQALDWAHVMDGDLVLEPSCGCGRIMDALRAIGVKVWGIEYDKGRAQQCRDKGHRATVGNFLEQPETPQFDAVIMNPPFAGKHYQKHIRHAMKFLKPSGELVAILPASAMYDHGFVEEIGAQWRDLPVASFAESGTNVPTGILKWKNK